MLKALTIAGVLMLQSFAVTAQPPAMEQLLMQYIEWAIKVDAQGLKAGTKLTKQELALARDVGVKHPENVRIIYVDEVPFPYENLALKALGENLGLVGKGVINNAQVFGYSIYVRKGYELNRPKLAHELVHVLQIERASLAQVVTQHIQDVSQYGYKNSPLEAEAFKANIKYKVD